MPVPISNVTRRAVYAPSGAGGAGPYAFTFEILANTDIAVYKDDVLLTLTTHYTVSIAANGTGSVTITATGLALAPVSPTQYAIVGNRTISRTTDFTTGGDFFANTLNDELDQQTIFAQQNSEGLTRSLQAPQTDPTTVDMTLPRASVRANKTLAFDSNGDPTTGEVIGDNRGNWSTSTSYNKRDIIKDTSNGNIYYANTSHTSTGSQPISSNADSAKWDLIVDNASAGTSATAAAASASAASTSASNASTSASNASTSASNASTSASTASTQASNASTSATAAASSASAASSSATAASGSASTATTQASNASTSASNASTSASGASTSATNAAASASTATTQASNASTSATAAAGSASAASTSASNAATSETNASNSATTASTQASNASTSASNASTSATNAASSAAAAASALDSFDDRYLGTKTSDPTLDNDGNALVAGALYFSTTSNVMKVYDGASWITATSAGATSLLRFRYVATSGQTTFSGADSASATLTYTVNNIEVMRNGVTLDTSEYTASNGTSIVLTVAAGTGDIIDIIAFKSFTVADALSAVSGGTVNGAVTITGVTTVQAGSAAAPAITTSGDTNTGIFFPAADTIAFAEGGAEAMRIDSSGNVGIGTSSPTGKLHVSAPASTQYGTFDAVTDTSAFTNYKVGGTTYGFIGDASGLVSGGTAGNLAVRFTGAMLFSGGANERMRIDSSGNLLVGQTTAAVETGSIVTAKNLEITRTIDSDGGALGQLSWVNNTNAGSGSGTSFAKDVACIKGLMDGTGNNSGGYLTFETKADAGTRAERMRINSSGNVILGSNTSTTANNVLNLWSPTSTLNGIYMQKSGQVEVQIGFKASTNTDFFIGTGSSTMGTNGVYLANTGNSWISVSDERQKDIIEPIENGLTKVSAIRAVIGKYKHDADGVRRSFLIAQDVQAVFPEAVKVQEDEEALLGLSYTDVIPLLVAAIKEQQALITALTTRITALENT